MHQKSQLAYRTYLQSNIDAEMYDTAYEQRLTVNLVQTKYFKKMFTVAMSHRIIE